MKGCFILESLCENTKFIVNPERIDSAFLPASTFKIPHALIALETGIADDGDFTMEWDGVERSVKSWNRTHALKIAIQNSVVWFFRETAKRIGNPRMSEWLNKLDYGNKDINGTEPFWLRGNLRITSNEQLKFMKQFYNESLPFKKESFEVVKNALLLEDTDTYSLYGKTGWAVYNGKNIGWLIGYVEGISGTYVYVTNVESGRENTKFGESRLGITKELLGILQAF